jgi:UDP-N-acetylmuramoyl-tripeptide--D-alanyl-D-alanine ligase
LQKALSRRWWFIIDSLLQESWARLVIACSLSKTRSAQSSKWRLRVLAKWNRAVVGITGSAGKTTIKDLTGEVLGSRNRVLKSLGNLNTTLGLPLTVTRMITGGAKPEDFDIAVLEMGMSSFGEIARLVDIAPLDVGIVGNVGTAHIEFFGSQDAIARAKAELVEGIKPGGTAVLNADDPRVIRHGVPSTRRLRCLIRHRP